MIHKIAYRRYSMKNSVQVLTLLALISTAAVQAGNVYLHNLAIDDAAHRSMKYALWFAADFSCGLHYETPHGGDPIPYNGVVTIPNVPAGCMLTSVRFNPTRPQGSDDYQGSSSFSLPVDQDIHIYLHVDATSNPLKRKFFANTSVN